ncbi:GNAT family N-acetyltransferase [Brachybacterium sp. DNPG3]
MSEGATWMADELEALTSPDGRERSGRLGETGLGDAGAFEALGDGSGRLVTGAAVDRGAVLSLRRLTLDDAADLHRIFSDPATHTVLDGPVDDPAITRDWLRRRDEAHRRRGVVWYGVRESRRLGIHAPLIGNAGLFFERAGEEPELGFEIRRPFQGRGFGRRIAEAVVAEGHRVGHRRIWAFSRPWNAASRRALARVGFVEVRTEADGRGPLIRLRHLA